MPISSSDIQIRLSGGSGNSSNNASLGGGKSTTVLSGNIFDTVSSAEATSGDTEYRCFYVHNAHATLTMLNTVAYLPANTPSADTSIEIAAGSAAINANEQSVADENTAPTGVTFAVAATKGAAVALGDIPPGQHKAVWLKRIVNSAAAAANDTFTPRIECDTLA